MLYCFEMYGASIFKRLFSIATGSLFIDLRGEGVKKAVNLKYIS